MATNDTDFSAAARLALRVPESEKRRVEGEVSDIGPVMLSAGDQGVGGGGVGGGNGGLPGGGTGSADSVGLADPADLADLTDLAEDQLRVDELRNDLLRELLEDSGAALAGGDGGGGGGGPGAAGIGIPGATLATRAPSVLSGSTGLGLGLGSIGATTGGAAAAGIGIPGIALAGILDDDSNPNPGELRDSPGETNVVTPDAEVSQRLERLLENGLNLNTPEWLASDGTIGVEEPENARVDLVKETLVEGDTSADPVATDPTEEEVVNTDPTDSDRPTEGGDIRLANAADQQAGAEEVVNTDPTDSDRPTEGGDIRLANAAEQATQDAVPTQGGDIRLANAADRQADTDDRTPGGSSPPVSDIGGPGADTSTGAALVEAVLGDVGDTPDGSPGGSTPSRTGRRNEAAARRRQTAPNIDVEARVESDGISEREAERIAEDKATEAAEEIRDQIARSRR